MPGERRGFRWRVIAGMVGAVVVSLLLLGVASVVVARRELEANVRRSALEETRAAEAVVEDRLLVPDAQGVEGLMGELREIGDFEVLTLVDGEQVRSDDTLSLDDVPDSLREPGAGSETAAVETALGPFLVTATRFPPGVDYYLFFPLDRLHRDTVTLTRVVATTGGIVAVVVLAGTLLVSRRVLHPVDETAAAARRMAEGVLGTRVSVATGTFTDLGDAFNDMARALQETIERLADLEARQRQFVADVAHELRTPLTALATAADLLEPAVGELSGPQQRAAETLVQEVRRLRQMVLDLMEISRLDADVAEAEPQPVFLSRLLPQIIEHHPDAADIALEISGDPIAVGDPRRVHAMVRNLLDNAFEHGRSPVDVIARSVEDRVEVDVVDHGDGIPASIREHVFERFFKGDQARTGGRGSGLGLAIVRDNARRLQGDVVLCPQAGGEGARFRLILPAMAPLDAGGEAE